MDTSMLPFGYRKKVRDRKYLNTAKDKPCEACGKTGTTCARHIRHGEHAGMQTKPDDSLVLFLCFECDQQCGNGDPEWILEHITKPWLRRRYHDWWLDNS